MPYIGPPAPNRFVAPKAATQFSGDGSTTAFTLDHAVGSDEDILVSVDGVIQEPSVAYAVSNGTTLTFTAAPSSNSGNNIFVYYLFRTVGTVSHPSNNALSASNATITGDLTVDTNTLKVDSTNNRVGIGVTSPAEMLEVYNATLPAIQLNDGGDYQAIMRLAGNDLEIRGSSGALELYNGAADGDSSSLALSIDSTGAVTKPLQPAFLAKLSSQQANLAINTVVTLLFATEVFDQNADYNNSNYTFTAPITGRYQLNVNVLVTSIDYDVGYYQIQLTTSNRTYYHTFDPDFGGKDYTYFNQDFSVLADMDASDTVKVNIYQSGGAAQTDIDAVSTFSGYLVA